MKRSTITSLIPLVFVLVGIMGCATSAKQMGDNAALRAGKEYVLQRNVILLANRGSADSVAHSDFVLPDYAPHQDYDPYYINPVGVLARGTVIEIQEIRLSSPDRFVVMGEIKTGPYKMEERNAYNVAKGLTTGPWPRTGKVVLNQLCGGRSFDATEVARHLVER